MPSPITLRTAGDERNAETIHLHPGGFPQGWVIRQQPASAPDQTPAGLSGGERSVSKYPHKVAVDPYSRCITGLRVGLTRSGWCLLGLVSRCLSRRRLRAAL